MPDLHAGQFYYVYAVIATDGIPRASPTGVGDAPLEFVQLGPFSAVVSVVGPEGGGSLRADLAAYTETLDWLSARTTVIPVAFGTVLDDAGAVLEYVLEPRVEQYGELLSRLEGSAQYHLRGIYVRDRILTELVLSDANLSSLHRRTRDLPQDQPHPELVKLGEGVSAALDEQRARDSDRILSAIAPHVTDLRDRLSGDLDQVFNVAMLVPAGQLDAIESTLEEIAEAEHERLRLQLTGPFPAYDFVGAD